MEMLKIVDHEESMLHAGVAEEGIQVSMPIGPHHDAESLGPSQ